MYSIGWISLFFLMSKTVSFRNHPSLSWMMGWEQSGKTYGIWHPVLRFILLRFLKFSNAFIEKCFFFVSSRMCVTFRTPFFSHTIPCERERQKPKTKLIGTLFLSEDSTFVFNSFRFWVRSKDMSKNVSRLAIHTSTCFFALRSYWVDMCCVWLLDEWHPSRVSEKNKLYYLSRTRRCIYIMIRHDLLWGRGYVPSKYSAFYGIVSHIDKLLALVQYN